MIKDVYDLLRCGIVIMADQAHNRPFTMIWAEGVSQERMPASGFTFADAVMGLQSEESLINTPEEGTNYSTDQTSSI